MSEPRGDTAPEEALSSFIERSDDLFTVVDAQGRFVYVNARAESFLGPAPEACLGRTALDFVHPDDRERTTQALARWLEPGCAPSEPFENRQVNEITGEVRHALWTVAPEFDADGRLLRICSLARDITELRRVETELSTKEVYVRSIFSGMHDAVITIDAHGTIREASNGCLDVFGYHAEELCGQNVSVLMPEPHRSQHDGYLEKYRRTGETWILNTTREFECVHKNGEALICELSVSRIDVPDGGTFFCGSFRDVTERVQTEAELAASERRFRAVFDQEFQYVGMLAPDGTLLEVNQAALELIKVDRSEVIGEPFWETPWWSHSEQDRDRMREAVEAASLGELSRFETDVSAKGCAKRSVDFSVKPVLDDDGAVLWLVAEGRDITALKKALERETSMLRAFASIGESASVLAHEIKNPITAVNAALRAVATQLGENEQLILAELVQRMQKLERLIRRTLSFAKPLDLLPRPVRLEDCFGELSSMLVEEVAENGCELTFEVADGCPCVIADDSLLEEVLHNLVRNAMEAGCRTVRVTGRPASGERIRISVEDDGPGITPSVLPRMFDPFVTTKATGTGIGLALSRKIVEQHGGEISAGTSNLGGACFDIHLPKSRD